MWWKYYLCTDPIVFRFEPTEFSDGHLQWAIDVHPRFQQRGTLLEDQVGSQEEVLLGEVLRPGEQSEVAVREDGKASVGLRGQAFMRQKHF